MTSESAPVVVIGAGIIGTAIAYELRRQGLDVVLIDRGEPGMGASFGNMASIAVTEFMPASRPAIWRQIPHWLLDPDGPVRLPAAYLPKLAPWLLRFLAAGRPSHVRKIEAAGAALCGRVYEDLLPLLASAGLSDQLSSEGCMGIYATEKEWRAGQSHLDLIRRSGGAIEILEPEAARALEPALTPDLFRCVVFPRNRTIRDPHALVRGLANRFLALGGMIERGTVEGFELSENRLAAIRLQDGRRLETKLAVLCAGARTGQLSKRLGEPIPLETERGYHSQIMAPGVALRHALIWPARGFMVSPTGGGIRVGGSVEMAGLDAAPDYRRARILVRHAKGILPRLQTDVASEWMGHRPALPDTIPIIGASARVEGVHYATGHGHLGLTLAATTARLMSDVIMERKPPIDMTPYRVDRF